MVRTSQGGSVLSFVIIGVILIGLLLGGAYFVSQQSAQPEDTAVQPPTSAPEQTKPSPDEPATPPAPVRKDDKPANTPVTPQPATPSVTHELPKTGTKEVFGTLFVLAIFSATVVSYARSRRPSLSL
ncbi:MAG TPA: hypothetical protein VK502_02775 [Candidatus Saccharimonadales bacterium]|nr:hypothetical protein [Candidatus Saccharimonadales bacterium]